MKGLKLLLISVLLLLPTFCPAADTAAISRDAQAALKTHGDRSEAG